MKVRAAGPADLETVQELWEGLYGEFPAQAHRQKVWGDVVEDIRGYIAENVVLIAEEEGSAVGFVVGWPENERVGYVGLLYVQPAFRRRGIGRVLLREAGDRLDRTFVTLSVDAGDQEALGFYRHLGFREDAVNLVIESGELT